MPAEESQTDKNLERAVELLKTYHGELDEAKRQALRSDLQFTDDEWEDALDLWSDEKTDA